jgi:hypothetical protein
MTAPPSQTQWYIARDGQQFGPLSEPELAKFIDLGHLQPTDLLWRDGFPDWRPALAVFPPRKPAAPARAAAPQMATTGVQPRREGLATMPANRAAMYADNRTAPAYSDSPFAARPAPARAMPPAETEPARSLLGLVKLAAFALIALAILVGVLWYGYGRRAHTGEHVPNALPLLSDASRPKDFEVPPFAGFTGSPEAINATLQGTPLWRVLKRTFPDWYAERLKEIAALVAQKQDETAIGQQMAKALVALRRQNVNYALSASFPRIKAVAVTFYDNVVGLQKQSSEACFDFISQGEASPTIVGLLRGSPHVARLQAQLTAVFEAIADGRATPRVYPQPHKTDYDALASDLTRRGWTQADMQLFSDERALAHAGAAKVCQMVQDWFAAQLAVSDQDMQLRLLVDSLKPVVAG